jgi:putative ABC transport system substrate-binding protein
MKRREFITLLGGAAAASSNLWSFAARAQQSALPVIGFLGSTSSGKYGQRLARFRLGLKEAGYVEDQNVAVQYRWADDDYKMLPALAADLVRRQVAVIVAGDGPAVPAVKAATSTIPVVFQTGYDPVQFGLVASLNRPGGNLTGVTVLTVELMPKLLELLHEVAPTASVIALLLNPTNANAETQVRILQASASGFGLQLHVLHATTESEIDSAFATLVKLRAGGLVLGTDTFINSRSEQIATLALRYAVPAISQFREFAMAGGLMSYGSDITDSYHLVGNYTGRILKGEKPADLPVQQSTNVELYINQKTAKALGLTVPQALLSRADEVIE